MVLGYMDLSVSLLLKYYKKLNYTTELQTEYQQLIIQYKMKLNKYTFYHGTLYKRIAWHSWWTSAYRYMIYNRT